MGTTDHPTESAGEKPARRPRQRGQGTLYQRGEVWWVQYFVHGRRVRESAETTNRRTAQDFLNGRLGRAAEGRPIPPRVDKITYADLAADLRLHYQTTGRRTTRDVERCLRPLDAFFAEWRVVDLDEAAITQYVAARQASTSRRGVPPANGTINRELSLLGTMLRLAARRRKCQHPPTITLLKEAAPRAGFFEPAQFAAVRRQLRPDLQLAVDLAYTYGWRIRDEVFTLQRRHVDLETGTIRLDPGSTKNADGRLVYLTPALAAGFAEQLDRVRALEHRLGRIVPHVFAQATRGPYNPKTGVRLFEAGDRVLDCRGAWGTACKRAGCPGMLKHDFRRTAVRNLVNDGTPEKVAMTITGHRPGACSTATTSSRPRTSERPRRGSPPARTATRTATLGGGRGKWRCPSERHH
jgi:integrase